MRLLIIVGSLLACSLYLAEGKGNFAAWHSNVVARYKKNMNREKRQAACDSNDVYRSFDGSCNNLNNPGWGANGAVYERLLPPVYEDGVQIPRLNKVDGTPLPSPRSVSVQVHDFDRERPHNRGTVMLMEWGQFLAHDITWTPTEEVTDNNGICCYTDELVTGGLQHPDVQSGGPCHPIIVTDNNDRYFNQDVSHRCKEFARSEPVMVNGVRQQKNMLSAYIDGQNVYGHDDLEMEALRANDGTGRLKTFNNNLPQSGDSDTPLCIEPSSPDYCMAAGDFRVNIYPGLGSLHTVFMRFHNYVADELRANHADWDGDRTFQEARKIVIAVLQRITYSEYLPMILGRAGMTAHGLNSEWSYDDSCDAGISNVFATAAFRFGHSMVTDSLEIDGNEVDSVDLFERPEYVLNSLDSLLEGMASKSAERADRWYSEGMTDHLFEKSAGQFLGTDIASLNIQRGRDHGLPAYNEWREYCQGVQPWTDISQLPSSQRFQRAYGDDVNDIDLYSGALNERPEGASVGPTYVCLLGQQFAKIRNCDRFWYENTDTTIGFSSERRNNQQRELRKMGLSNVLCLTTSIAEIQPNVFQMPDNGGNAVKSCESIRAESMDFDLF